MTEVMTTLSEISEKPKFKWTLSGRIGLGILLFWVLIAISAPLISPYGLADFVSDEGFAGPNSSTLLGTDYLARDMLSRIIGGSFLTLSMALAASVIATGLGSALGLFSSMHLGVIDAIISRIVDVIHSFPTLMLSMVVIVALGPTIPLIVVMTGLIYATSVYRISRALGMDIAVLDFVAVARARGEKTPWILIHEILPNVLPPLLVDFGMRLCFSILFISSLSFLGLGVQPPLADWGSLVRENMAGLLAGSLAGQRLVQGLDRHRLQRFVSMLLLAAGAWFGWLLLA